MSDQHEDANRSVWTVEREARSQVPPTPSLAGRLRTDVAIVGGGFTGVSTALHLRRARPELGIALLEAGVLGQGASGRNGGQVLHWINGVSPRTPEELRRNYAATGLGIDIAEELATKHAPPGTFRRAGALEVLTDARRAEEAHARAERWNAAGIAAEFIPASRLGIAGAHGAVRNPRAGRLNGYALLQALRPVLTSQGIALHEVSRVTRIRGGSEISLETTRGEVRAKTLVLATNGYTPALGFFRGGVLPLHSHVLATAELEDADWQRLGWGAWDGFSDDQDRIAYAMRTPGGRLLLGGGGNPAYTYHYGSRVVTSEAAIARSQPFMQRVLQRYFPAVAHVPIEHRWSGVLGITLDRQPSIGSGLVAPNVLHALGYSGHGVSLALLAGRVLADLYTGNPDPWRDLAFFNKRLLPLPPEPLRWLGYQAYTKLTGRSPRKQA
jgi:glycine/D-amino acid oxidase-like deaminating enzyme